MKKLSGILLGILLSAVLIICADQYMNKKIIGNKESVRNYRAAIRFGSREAQKLVIDENTLPIFGSSELVPLEDYEKNISSFLNGDEMNVMTIGMGYYQSLNHTMTLGAIADGIKSKKVALFLSPQWFTEAGVPATAFPERFSEDNLLGFLESSKISDENKVYVLERTLQLLTESPTQYARVEKYKDAFEQPVSLNGIYTQIMNVFWGMRQKYEVYKQLDTMPKELPKLDLGTIDYDAMLKLAEQQGKKSCTNNGFGINDEYWNTYIKDSYTGSEEVKDKRQVYTESPEYEDLKHFLSVAQDLDIEVILVSIPLNGKWSAYQGMLGDVYYEKIREIAREYEDVCLVDMSVYEDEKYFFKDAMHLGWKGWTRINEALYKEFTQ